MKCEDIRCTPLNLVLVTGLQRRHMNALRAIRLARAFLIEGSVRLSPFAPPQELCPAAADTFQVLENFLDGEPLETHLLRPLPRERT